MDTDGSAPVWVTVLAARFVGGFAGALAVFVAIRGSVTAPTGQPGAAHTQMLLLTVLPMIAGALITGVAITMLLPSMSGRVVGLGNALLAAVSGAAVPLIATLLVARGLASSTSPTSVVLIAGASPFVTLLATVGSVVVTSWMVATVSARPATGISGRRSVSPATERWSDIEAIDTRGTQLDEQQAERGYWGGLSDPGDDPSADPDEAGR
jgi:hypothetical protein